MNPSNPRLAVFVSSIGLFIMFLIAAVVWKYYGYFDETMTTQVYYEQKVAASLASVTLKNRVADLIESAESYAKDSDLIKSIKSGESTNVRADLRKVYFAQEHDYFIDYILVLNATGKTMGGFPIAPKMGVVDQVFSKIKSPGDPYVSGVLQRDDGRTNYIAILAPVKSGTDVIGYVELQVPVNLFSDFGKNIDPASTGFSYYVDQNGMIITHPKFESDGPIIDYSNVPAVKEILAGRSDIGEFYNPVEKVQRLSVYQTISPYGWGVVTTAPVAEIFVARDEILRQIIVYGVVAGLINVIIMVGAFLKLKK